MAVLYLTEQGAIVRKTGDRLIVEKDGKKLAEIPCAKLESILVFGNVQVTTPALAELLDHGIELAFLTVGGRLRGQLTPPKAKNMPLRMRQYDAARDEPFRLALARELVRAKVENAAAMLARHRGHHQDRVPREAIESLETAALSVEKASSLDALRGVEGAAAARYFGAFPGLLPEGWTFPGRQRRPPPDPVNALLSFGYVLVGNELQSLLDAIGFDPYLGFFHEVEYGRPSLALDLLEEFRAPLVDRFAATLLQLGTLRREDFVAGPEGGVVLGREGLKTYFAAWERGLAQPIELGEPGERPMTFRDLFRRQAERLARALTEGEPYRGFRLPC